MFPRWAPLAALILTLTLPVTAPAQAQVPPATIPLTLDAAIVRALATNPAIAAARLRRPISAAELQVAREHLNPEARVELARETPKEAYSFAVPWELGGKRSRRIAVAEAAILTSEAELTQAVVEVRSAVRRAYFDGVIAEARLALLDELQDLAVRVRDAAQARFDAGGAPRLEVVQAQLALAETQNQAAAIRGTVVAARVTLNALLGLPLDLMPVLATTFEAGPVMPADAALGRARSASAELALLDRRLDEQRARIALARSLQTPDLTPEATVTRRSEPEFTVGWRAALAVTVPLFTRHRAGVLLEEAALAQITAQREAALARITGEVTAALALADAQRQQFLRYRDDIVPQAVSVERMAEDSYKLGQTGIAAFLQALQSSRDVRLRSLQSAADFQNALGDLERALGTPLP